MLLVDARLVVAGVGKALAEEFVRQGDSVIISSRSGMSFPTMPQHNSMRGSQALSAVPHNLKRQSQKVNSAGQGSHTDQLPRHAARQLPEAHLLIARQHEHPSRGFVKPQSIDFLCGRQSSNNGLERAGN